MISLSENVSLKPWNTFGVDVRARYLLRAGSGEALLDALDDPALTGLPRLILGGGSNMLFLRDWPGVVVHLAATGVAVEEERDDAVILRAGGGEQWHHFVRQSIAMGFAGLENLSLIPGSVGAAPVQNIGAYGVELASRFHSLEMIDLVTGQQNSMDRDACDFGYRDSWFKHQASGRHLITSVSVALPRTPVWTLGYGELAGEVARRAQGEAVTAALISDAVCDIRRRKLPDPQALGNAGSFFKNPVVSLAQADQLRGEFPDIPLYPAGVGYKLSAGWLIERCGWKGRRVGDAGVSAHHALILVNYGGASGADIWALAQRIIADVGERFGVVLEPEPRIPGVNMDC